MDIPNSRSGLIIPDYIPTIPSVERRIDQAVRQHDSRTLLSIVETQPEVQNYLLRVPPLDLIKTMIKDDQLIQWLLFWYPPLPLDNVVGLSSAELDYYLERIEQAVGHVPVRLLNGIKGTIRRHNHVNGRLQTSRNYPIASQYGVSHRWDDPNLS